MGGRMNIKTAIILFTLSLLVSCASNQSKEPSQDIEQPQFREGMFGNPQ
jgi:hypothetical protein